MVNFKCLLCFACGTLGRWRGCVYNVGRPLFVCACIVGTSVCVSIMLDACMTTDSYIRAVICRCTAYIFFYFFYFFRLCIY